MPFLKTCCLMLALCVLAGCAKNAQKAHEMAAANLYQEISYENAAQPGPSVMVLPGKISAASYEFLAKVKPDTLCEFAELELAKAGFTVREKSSLPDIYQEIALAANLGDGSIGQRFARIDAAPPHWLVIFDVTDVKAQTTAFTFTDKNSAAMAGALMGGIFLGAAGAQIGAGLTGSINSAEEQRRYDITLAYRILDGVSGQQQAQGNFTEQALISSELKGFLGVDAGQSGGITLGTIAHRLIQKAVQDMDSQHKLPAMAVAEAAAAAPKPAPGKAARSGKAAKGPAKTPPAPDLSPLRMEERPEVSCIETSLCGVACQLPVQWSAGAPPSAREVAVAKKPELGKLLEQLQKSREKSLLDAMVEFDILRTAGPLVTLSEPESPISEMGRAVALSGDGLEGRVFVLTKVPGHVTPEKLATAIVEHMRRSCVVEPLAIETVTGKDGVNRPITVFKYIQVEQRKEALDVPDYDRDSKPQSKLISIPHYHNMAMAVIQRGGSLIMVIAVAPEDRFLPHLEGVKKLVESIG